MLPQNLNLPQRDAFRSDGSSLSRPLDVTTCNNAHVRKHARAHAHAHAQSSVLHALGHWQIGMPCEDQSGARLQAVGCRGSPYTSQLSLCTRFCSTPYGSTSARYLDRGTTRCYSRAPARQGGPWGPYSEDRHPVYPQRFNWFESTPKDASQLDRDLNQQSVLLVNYIVHTHVMSNV
jgi:hypothetical protein